MKPSDRLSEARKQVEIVMGSHPDRHERFDRLRRLQVDLERLSDELEALEDSTDGE